ncbi:uncharacterized protein DNG_08216 [Cephalotrichum gorgonifer]|uniref:Uncharacterized protein n=1 Tax=Cephalotrichum gorgonifer TaxID=2041049 RepID=A0AAE8N4P7_9PEZI|nr:uncharacterized protein DNG_08216 [Cephalotrichum gorgonifer]
MEGHVEARSLSSLNHIADNPPQYPINPTGQHHEPLVLYLSRVPGTRDVILSPAKPQLKNVTGEDVGNCLYYVHLDLPEEAIEPPVQQRQSLESVRSQNVIPRKPLPANSRAALNPSLPPPVARPSPGPSSPVTTPPDPQLAGGPRAASAPDPAFSTSPPAARPRVAFAPEPASPIPPPAADLGSTAAITTAPIPRSTPSPTPSDPPPPYPGPLSPERRPSPDDHGLRPALPPRPASVDPSDEVRPDLPPRPVAGNPYSPDPAAPHPPPHGVRFAEPGSSLSDPGSLHSPSPISPRPTSHGVRFSEPAVSSSDAAFSRPLEPLAHRPPPHGAPLAEPRGSSRELGSNHVPESRAQTAAPTRHGASRTPSPGKDAGAYTPYVPFSLTIIRRDPSSGKQWNVGKVTSSQIETEEESGYIHQRPAGDTADPPPINIRLENSGYNKFRGMPTLQSLDGRPHTAASVASASAAAAASSDPPGAFCRQALMTYSKGWRSNIREKFRKPDPDSDLLHARGHSRDRSTDSTDSDNNEPITQPGPGLRPQGYTFASPWDGRCVFRTGNAGRSVVCRHVTPETPSHGSNPLVHASAERRMAKLGVYPPVSELRFNLPVADLLRSREEAAQQLHDHFAKLVRPKHGGGEGYSSDEEYSVLPFDLSLGKEKAGGGRRGRRAKLGKLIIYDEGIKMLDLVVAANMGIWWGAWEKSFWA